MLNYMNQNVYLPKMAPLKQGCRRVWGLWGVWGGWEVFGVNRGWYGEKEVTPHWIILTT